MKKLFALCSILALVAGCQTAPTAEDIAGYISDARDIAETGTEVALLENASYRHELELTRDALKALESTPAGSITAGQFLDAMAKLPIPSLQSKKGQIALIGSRVLVRRFASWVSTPQVDVVESGYIQQFAKALREGIDAGLGASPAPVTKPSSPPTSATVLTP